LFTPGPKVAHTLVQVGGQNIRVNHASASRAWTFSAAAIPISILPVASACGLSHNRAFPMSQSTDLNIDHVAKLARLALTPQEKATFAHQLGDVLHHIEQLQKVDVSNVEPAAHAFAVYNVWAEDKAQPGLPREAALRNAPAQREHMISVPKVVE
jgi:aspartyl-tRNA(Asn)/glutamyl-tRNA(Gln) amidotransferase subunit C